MVETLLLAGIGAAPLGSAGLFVPIRRRTRAAGIWPTTRRTVLALAGTCLLAAAVAIALRLLGVTRYHLVAAAVGVVFASLIWLPVTRRWNARAHLCWASSVFLFVVYLTFALEWTFASHLGPAGTTASPTPGSTGSASGSASPSPTGSPAPTGSASPTSSSSSASSAASTASSSLTGSASP